MFCSGYQLHSHDRSSMQLSSDKRLLLYVRILETRVLMSDDIATIRVIRARIAAIVYPVRPFTTQLRPKWHVGVGKTRAWNLFTLCFVLAQVKTQPRVFHFCGRSPADKMQIGAPTIVRPVVPRPVEIGS